MRGHFRYTAAWAGSCPRSWAEAAVAAAEAAAILIGRFWGRARLELQIIPLDLPSLFSIPLLGLQLIVEESFVLADVDGG